MAWMIVLLGAALTAWLPRLIAGIARDRSGVGWQFQLALEVLAELDRAAAIAGKGMTAQQLSRTLSADMQRLEPVLAALTTLDWIAQLKESEAQGAAGRYVLLALPEAVTLEPLLQTLLLPRNPATERLWLQVRWSDIRLCEVIR